MLDSSFLGQVDGQEESFTRLETTWTYSEPEGLRRWHLGDVISGSLTWTRPVRLGGGQLSTDFSLRPDLVTFPTPLVRGDAAVPSSVDIYVNSIRRLSENVRPGPFEILDLPW